METNYIIKDNKIYEKISKDKAARVEIKDGIAKINEKDTVEYDNSDFAYTFFEIKQKFAPLFETSNGEIENADEYERIIGEKDKIIQELEKQVKQLENKISELQARIEELENAPEEQEDKKQEDKKQEK